MTSAGELHDAFGHALRRTTRCARAGEICCAWLQAERSDFIRLNGARVRQAGTVTKASIEIRLIVGSRQASLVRTLSADATADARALDEAVDSLRAVIADSEPDPHLAIDGRPRQAHSGSSFVSPDPTELCAIVRDAAGDADLVGFYAAGPMACGFASSLGHDLWHETGSWFFDYSIHANGDKAVKATVAESHWTPEALRDSIRRSRQQARILSRPPKVIAPGHYRACLAPAALADIVGMLNWGGFSMSALRSGQSPLTRLRAGVERFSSRVSLRDDLCAMGLPAFQADGFARPDSLPLIDAGGFANALVSPRSAREFGVCDTGAAPAETADALSMAGGDLDDALLYEALGTGVAVSNLWYLNWSDRAAGRITGMTRFATLWVEVGEPVAPLSVMRFDDSLVRLLGSELERLTRHPQRIPDTMTYEARGFGAMRVPGAVLASLNLSL